MLCIKRQKDIHYKEYTVKILNTLEIDIIYKRNIMKYN